MKRRTFAVVLMLAMVLTSCGTKSENNDAGGTENEGEERVLTASTREDAKELANAFYLGVLSADTVSMKSYSDGQMFSEFKKNGDTVCSCIPLMGSILTTYGFIDNGVKYSISDGETALEDADMYDTIADSVKTTLAMFVMGYYDAKDDTLQFSAMQTDKTTGGVITSKLVTVITDEADVQKLTVTGTTENGAVSDILCQIESGEEKQTYEFVFTYGNVSIELPAYTVNAGGNTVNAVTCVESPYQTLGEMMATLGEEESPLYTVEENRVYVIGEKDGRYYQFSAAISTEDQKALDSFSGTYDKNCNAILAKLVVDDCIDFTDILVPQTELDTFIGKTAQEILDAGYQTADWSADREGATLTFSKNCMNYIAELAFPDGFNSDNGYDKTELYSFTVEQFHFSEPEYYALPLQ